MRRHVRREIIFSRTIVLTVRTLIAFTEMIFALVSLQSDFMHVSFRTQIATIHCELLLWPLLICVLRWSWTRKVFGWNLHKQWQLFIILAIIINVYYLFFKGKTCNDINHEYLIRSYAHRVSNFSFRLRLGGGNHFLFFYTNKK